MPDWRRNVLSTSEAFLHALHAARHGHDAAVEPTAASYPRRSDRLRAPASCPYTTIFLGGGRACPPPSTDASDLYADARSVDRSSNCTDTSSFAHYEDRRDDVEVEKEQTTLQVQKVPHTASVFYVSARGDSSREQPAPASELFLVDADSDALSSCTCDSFERCEFDCRDYEPFSDTCCCEPLAGGACSRSPGGAGSPDRWPDDGASARSDMDGLDLALFEPASAAARPRLDNALSGVLHALTDAANDSCAAPGAGRGTRGGAPPPWEPYYCVLLQDRRTLTAYSSEELANNKSGEYASRSLPRVRLDGGGVRLRCWAAPPSITEEDAEDEPEADTASLRAVCTVGKLPLDILSDKDKKDSKAAVDTSYEKACRRGSAPSTPVPGGGGPQHSPSRLASFFFTKRSFRGNPLKRTKSATKLERERALAAGAAPQPLAAHALRTSRSHESLLSAHSPAVSTMDLGPPHQVEIRALHSSVLGRPHCFALSAENRAPRYFACASRKQRDRWIYSLRQAARPEELRGRRCERTIKLWLLEAKAIPPKKRYYCEILLDDTLYARTSSKLKTELCFWGEVYEFGSLPAVGAIVINVYREPERKPRKRDKQSLVGSVRIPVDDVSSRYLNERWYPILPDKGSDKGALNSSASSQSSAGRPAAPPSLRVKCRYQSVDILPIDAYAHFLDYLKRNYRKICECLEPVIGVKAKEDIGCAMVLCMAGCGQAPRYLADVVALDVRRTGDHSLTFRGNSLATKSMEAYLKLVGDQYLQDTLTEAVTSVAGAAQGVDCEVDPLRAGGGAALRRQQAALREAVELAWRRIAGSAQHFPPPLRECFATFRERLTAMGRDDISDNLISASIFLRFLCPAILSPSLFGITHEYPNERAARNLTLVAKTLQTLANFTRFQGKEAFMEFLNDFLEREAPRMKAFLREISSRPPEQEAAKRLSGVSQASGASGASAAERARVETEPEWAPHVDLGRQLATLHALLADSLGKLPPGRLQELDPLSDILDDLSKRQLNTDSNAAPLQISDNIFRFNDPTCNAQTKLNLESGLAAPVPAANFAHSSPLVNKNGVQFNISPSKSNVEDSKYKSSYASVAKSPSFNSRSATLPRNGYGSINSNINPDRYSSQYNNQEHCVNLKVVQIGMDQYAKGLPNGVNENGHERRLQDRYKPSNYNRPMHYNANYNGTERSPSSDSINHNYCATEMQNLIGESATLEELSDLLKYADDSDIVDEKMLLNKKNSLNQSNNNVVNGNKPAQYATNGSNVSISALSNVASSGYQSFATYSQSSSPVETTNHHPFENGQPLSRYSQLNYQKQRDKQYCDKFYAKNPVQQKIDYDIQKYGIQNFTTDNGQNNGNSTLSVAPLVFTNPVYNMEDNRQSPARVDKSKAKEKRNSKRCPCGSSSSSVEEDTTETNSEEGSTNLNEDTGTYERRDRNSHHRKLTRESGNFDGDYHKTNHEHSPREDSSNAPSLRKGSKTRMPRTNPMLSYSTNQNQLNLKHFGQRGESLYESKPHHITSDGYPVRSDSNVEEVNKEMYRLQISRSQKALYNMENNKSSPEKYTIPENSPPETNYPLDRTYSGAKMSSTRLNEEPERHQDVYYCVRERDSPVKTATFGSQGHGSDASHGHASDKSTPKEKLQRRLSLESARELTDSSSEMEDTHYSTTGRRRTNKHHRTIEQYEREIERLKCSVEVLRGRLGPGDGSVDHADTKMKTIISRLICVEEELRREQRKMAAALSHKQRVIEAQGHRIAVLNEANTRLLSELVHLQRAPSQHRSHAELQI